MSAGSDIEHGAIGDGQFNQFFVPEAMLRIPGEVARESAMMSPTIPI